MAESKLGSGGLVKDSAVNPGSLFNFDVSPGSKFGTKIPKVSSSTAAQIAATDKHIEDLRKAYALDSSGKTVPYLGTFVTSDVDEMQRLTDATATYRPNAEVHAANAEAKRFTASIEALRNAYAPGKSDKTIPEPGVPASLGARGEYDDIQNQIEFDKLETDQQELITQVTTDKNSPLYEMSPLRAYAFLKRSGNLGPVTSFSQENSENPPFNISDMLSDIFRPGGSVPGSNFNVGFDSQDRGAPGLAGLQAPAPNEIMENFIRMVDPEATAERRKELEELFAIVNSITARQPQRIGPQTADYQLKGDF